MAIKKAAEAAFSFCCCLRSVPLAQFLDRGELGNGFGQFGLGLGVLELRGLVLQRFLGLFLGVEGLGFVEVLAADGGVGQHGDEVGLHFEHAAGDENEFFGAVLRLDAHDARLDAGEQRRVAGHDAQLAGFTRENDELRQPREDGFFRADDVDVYCHGHIVHSLSPALSRACGRRREISYCRVLAFSKASSMVPTM